MLNIIIILYMGIQMIWTSDSVAFVNQVCSYKMLYLVCGYISDIIIGGGGGYSSTLDSVRCLSVKFVYLWLSDETPRKLMLFAYTEYLVNRDTVATRWLCSEMEDVKFVEDISDFTDICTKLRSNGILFLFGLF